MANNVCTTLLEAYERAYLQAKKWQTPQLVLGWATVVFIIVGVGLVIAGLRTEGIVSSGLSLVSGGAAVWFNGRVKYWHEEAEQRLKEYVEKCSDRMDALVRVFE
jgi:hypothetical protein